MPITEELKNIKKFESVGFTHEQAEVLAEIQEDTALKGMESLKEFISDKLDIQSKDIQQQFKDLRNIDIANIHAEIKDLNLRLTNVDSKLTNEIKNLDSKLSNEIKNLDSKLSNEIKLAKAELNTSLAESQRDMLLKISGIIAAIVTVIVGAAVTIIKLF